MDAIPKDTRYTYADYLTWNDEVRYELIDGVPHMMSPAPAWEHQSISVELCGQLRDFLKGKPCKVFAAPFDVRLSAREGDDTVVQPDLLVICDLSKLSGTGCVGAPDMVIEILSPSTAGRDCIIKYQAYLNAEVREYWVVDPETKTVLTHMYHEGEYKTHGYAEADTVPVHVLDGCTIRLADVFAV